MPETVRNKLLAVFYEFLDTMGTYSMTYLLQNLSMKPYDVIM